MKKENIIITLLVVIIALILGFGIITLCLSCKGHSRYQWQNQGTPPIYYQQPNISSIVDSGTIIEIDKSNNIFVIDGQDKIKFYYSPDMIVTNNPLDIALTIDSLQIGNFVEVTHSGICDKSLPMGCTALAVNLVN